MLGISKTTMFLKQNYGITSNWQTHNQEVIKKYMIRNINRVVIIHIT